MPQGTDNYTPRLRIFPLGEILARGARL